MKTVLEQLAEEITKSRNRNEIIKEIEWFLQGHYTKCRFLAVLMTYRLFKPEYRKLSEELENRDLLLKLYILIKENIKKQS